MGVGSKLLKVLIVCLLGCWGLTSCTPLEPGNANLVSSSSGDAPATQDDDLDDDVDDPDGDDMDGTMP